MDYEYIAEQHQYGGCQAKIDGLTAENDTLRARLHGDELVIAGLRQQVERLEGVARAGIELSTHAAAINWSSHETNTWDWLTPLAEKIERVQELAKVAGLKIGGMKMTSPVYQQQAGQTAGSDEHG